MQKTTAFELFKLLLLFLKLHNQGFRVISAILYNR